MAARTLPPSVPVADLQPVAVVSDAPPYIQLNAVAAKKVSDRNVQWHTIQVIRGALKTSCHVNYCSNIVQNF